MGIPGYIVAMTERLIRLKVAKLSTQRATKTITQDMSFITTKETRAVLMCLQKMSFTLH